MQNDRHESICRMIDKSLVGGASVQEEQSLREHLLACGACQEYLNACNRAIASLGGFSFYTDPGLPDKVFTALALRAQQLETKQIGHRQLWWSYIAALILTVVGSFAAMQLGDLVGAVFSATSAQVQFGLIAFWIVPSVCFCLLLPALPMVSAGWMKKKGLSL